MPPLRLPQLPQRLSQPLPFRKTPQPSRETASTSTQTKEEKIIEITNSTNFVQRLAESGTISQQELEEYQQQRTLQLSIDELANEIFTLIQKHNYNELKELFGLNQEDIKYLAQLTETPETITVRTTTQPTVEPTATPTPTIEYYRMGISSNGAYGHFDDTERGSVEVSIRNASDFSDYLLKEGVITSRQRRALSAGEYIKVPKDKKLSAAVYKLLRSKGKERLAQEFGINQREIDVLLSNFDRSSLESNPGTGTTLPEDNYVVINDGRLETYVTDDYGNTTQVKIGTVDTDELLDYLLDQGKITIEQRDAYGDSRSLEISLKDVADAADVIDWRIDSDEGFYIGINEQSQNYLRDTILPLFTSDK